MCVRYYHDPETGQPHIYGHGVTEAEVEYVLRRPGEDRPGSDRPTWPSARRRQGATSG